MIQTHRVNTDPLRYNSSDAVLPHVNKATDFQDFMSLQRVFMQRIKHENEEAIDNSMKSDMEQANNTQSVFKFVHNSPDSTSQETTFDANEIILQNTSKITKVASIEKIDEQIINEVFTNEPDLMELLEDDGISSKSISGTQDISNNGSNYFERSPSSAEDLLVWEPIDCYNEEKTPDGLEVKMVALHQAMQKAFQSQKQLQQWDRKMGLRRCHSKTMTKTAKSRKKLRDLMELPLS
mmetsp:Transcript_19108/g.25087  ORF Transcript_19108/g.25087 Transcript_19108/m.25087 type:complete len:237 (-) Transcript_19108:675-1385(-)